MLAVAGAAQLIFSTAADHFDAVVDEELEAIHQAQLARLAVDDGKHDDAEAGLKLGVLIEVVEHHVGLLAALQLDDDAHAVAVAVIEDIGDALDALLIDHGSDLLEQFRLIDLIGNFGDHDLLAVFAGFLNGGAGADLKMAAAGGVGVEDSAASENEAAGGEIGAGHHFENRGERRFRVLDQVDGGVDDV